MGKIWQTYGNDAYEMTLHLLKASDAHELVPTGGSVALKPNIVVSAPPEDGAVTHPGVVDACIEYFRLHGVTEISVIESSWVGDETMRAMRTSGFDRVCKQRDVPFFDLKRDEAVTVATPIGNMKICRRALEADLLVDLPVLKGHCQTRMTCALKNLKGCIPDSEKRRFHTLGLTRPIAALGTALRPGLVIVDSICGDLCFEEGGTPVQTGHMYLGTDAVQADAFACSLMGLSLDDVPYVALAERFGAGSTAWSEDDIVTLGEPCAGLEGYSASSPHRAVAALTRRVYEDQACSACYAALVRALYTRGKASEFDVYIGQGWRGKRMDGLGIGRCCSGASRCVMGCPPHAAAIAKAL